MTNHSYQLVNPIIEGTFQDVYDAKHRVGSLRPWSFAGGEVEMPMC